MSLNFKKFLSESVGLGNLGLNLNNFMNNPVWDKRITGLLTSDQTGSEQSTTLGYSGHALHLPSHDIMIPQVEKTGRIDVLLKNKNPIYVHLTDGTEAFFTYDQFLNIEGVEPAIGKTMTIIFQRNPHDTSKEYSKIDKIVVRD